MAFGSTFLAGAFVFWENHNPKNAVVFGSAFPAGDLVFQEKLLSRSQDPSEKIYLGKPSRSPKRCPEILVLEPKSACQHLGSLVLDLGSAQGGQGGLARLRLRGAGGARNLDAPRLPQGGLQGWLASITRGTNILEVGVGNSNSMLIKRRQR